MSISLTSEEKIDAIYMMLRSDQARMKRAFWYRIIKWCLILGVGYFALSNPGYVTDKIMQYVWPIMVEQMRAVMATQKDRLLKQMKDLMPTQPVPKREEQY